VTRDRRRALLEVLLCSGFPTQIALAGLLRAAGMAPMTAEGTLSAAFVCTLSLADAAALITLVVMFLRRGREKPSAVFLGQRTPSREAALGLVLLPVTMVLVFSLIGLLHSVAPWLRNVPENPLEALLGTRAGFVAFLVVVFVAGGLREELQRAFLLHRFEQHLGGRAAGLAATSVAFGLGHTIQGWDAAIVISALGLAWGILYYARRSAVAGIVNHAFFDGIQLVGVILKGTS
jgi:membrane protease YdiL (CAAX protease family)